jgi:hypothetical protein
MRYCVLAALALAALTVPAWAQNDSLRVEIDDMAKEVVETLKGESPPVVEVAVGSFTGPATSDTSGGPLIQKTLCEALTKRGMKVQRTANVGIKGEYEDVKDAQSGLLAIQVTIKVTDRSGKTLVQSGRKMEFTHAAFGESLVASVIGVTAKLPPAANAKERSDYLEKAIEKPKCHLDGNVVCCAPSSDYAVEILVAPRSGAPYAPRRAKIDDGLAFVPLKRGEVFAVKLINRSKYAAAATLTLDGLNMYSFSDVKDHRGKPKYSLVIIPPGGKPEIKGWHRTNEVSDEFNITEFAKGAAVELKSTAKTGTIQVSFAAAWPKAGPKPPDEPANPNEHSRGAGADAIGRGQRVGAKFAEVEVPHDVGVVRETVSVRYTK